MGDALPGLDEIVAELARPAGSEVVHTHASVVVLLQNYVYKLKKPVDLGFLDYSTLERRQAMCFAEVELNRRLAPEVYLGVVPISYRDGRITTGGDGEVLEYAVQMRRLPEDATLRRRVHDGTVTPEMLERIGRRLAAFHGEARRAPDVSRWGRFEIVSENCRDNLTALAGHAGEVAPRAELERLAAATESELAAQRARIERRAAASAPCETHGDLRLEHVYFWPTPDDLSIIDCVEFSERFRCADPVSDVAFLAMDLQAHGAWSGAETLLDAYFAASRDADGRALVPLYLSYRSAVRAKVRAMQAADASIPAEARAHARQLARAHVQLALGSLVAPGERPALVLVGGLPGTGKSSLARGLADAARFAWLRADAVRKELAGLAPAAPARAGVSAGIYTPEWNERTYAELLARAGRRLFAGERVLVDASFHSEARRLAFVAAAREWGVPVRLLLCVADPALVRARLEQRSGDPSDADWSVYEHMRAAWEPPGAQSRGLCDEIDTAGPPDATLAAALAVLRRRGLSGERPPATAGP